MQITWFYCLWHVYKGTKPLDTICLVLCAPRPPFSWPGFVFSSIYIWPEIESICMCHTFSLFPLIGTSVRFGFFLSTASFIHAEKNVRGFMRHSRNNAFSLNYILFTVCVCASYFFTLWLMGSIVYDENTTGSSVLNKFCKTFGKVKCSM